MDRFGFRPGVDASSWPVIAEPTLSLTFDLSTPSVTEGTFGHPWEQTLCVFGERLVNSLGRTLATWLPIVRVDGHPSTGSVAE